MNKFPPIQTSLGAVFALALGVMVSACSKPEPWHGTEISGAMPDLSFTMTRAGDGQTVSEDAYRGKIVMLFFGYTFCPDVCPTTLSNLSIVLRDLGEEAEDVRVLFVTVDPGRDTLPVLKQYVDLFAPEIDGLRTDEGKLAALAKKYRVSYSVRAAGADHPYEVTHGSAVYVFDNSGKIRLLLSSLATASPDIEGAVSDIRRLLNEG